MATRTFCDIDGSEIPTQQGIAGTRIPLTLTMQLGLADARVSLDLCPKCARQFLPLLPKEHQPTWESAIKLAATGKVGPE